MPDLGFLKPTCEMAEPRAMSLRRMQALPFKRSPRPEASASIFADAGFSVRGDLARRKARFDLVLRAVGGGGARRGVVHEIRLFAFGSRHEGFLQ